LDVTKVADTAENEAFEVPWKKNNPGFTVALLIKQNAMKMACNFLRSDICKSHQIKTYQYENKKNNISKN
jgi:hypothetical protein